MRRTPAAWLREFRNIFLFLGGLLLLRACVCGLYLVPTASMQPTIQVDDRVVANLLSYGLRIPFLEKQLLSWATPHRGDVILFKGPIDGVTYVKRVAGVGGDTLSFSGGTLAVNGVPVAESAAGDDGGEALFLEEDLGTGKHFIVRHLRDGATAQETRIFTVPEHHLFCLGDNRDDSSDSRAWGVFPADEVYGKAWLVLFSTSRSPSLLPKFRTDRFFARLR